MNILNWKLVPLFEFLADSRRICEKSDIGYVNGRVSLKAGSAVILFGVVTRNYGCSVLFRYLEVYCRQHWCALELGWFMSASIHPCFVTRIFYVGCYAFLFTSKVLCRQLCFVFFRLVCCRLLCFETRMVYVSCYTLPNTKHYFYVNCRLL